MKYLLLILLLTPFLTQAQNKGWEQLDPKNDSVLGISSVKAYEYLKDKSPDTVIVAIIDNGAEISHEDLAEVIWVNTDEIPDNGIDDDNNGYIDDIHGWNYLGNSEGKNLKYDTKVIPRLYGQYEKQFGDKERADIDSEDREEYRRYLKIEWEHEKAVMKLEEDILLYEYLINKYDKSHKIITKYLKNENYTEEEVREIDTDKEKIKVAKDFLIMVYDNNSTRESLLKTLKSLDKSLETCHNPDFKNREEIVGDDPYDINDSIYGNNMVSARGPYHGTSVASVVGAIHNEIGVNGVTKHVKLMILRVVPFGAERDKDIALAIKYAVRNGADIINCSFGKEYAENYEFIEEAIAIAEKHGVLIISGAGNDAKDMEKQPYSPSGYNSSGVKSPCWIVVGASGYTDNEKLVANFSNYGSNRVDLFAPGLSIHHCALKNGYSKSPGTSMASPVVAAAAAILKSYYPHLTGSQIKEILMRSVYIPSNDEVILPGTKDKYVKFSDLSLSGGIVNVYQAILLAEKEYLNN